jgi:hypothetical protein
VFSNNQVERIQDLDDVVVRSGEVIEQAGTLSRERYSNDGTGRSYGLEVFVHHRLPG